MSKANKIMFYELKDRQPGDDRCIQCGFPIEGKQAIYVAKGIPGPFCRDKCAALYNDFFGRMKLGTA